MSVGRSKTTEEQINELPPNRVSTLLVQRAAEEEVFRRLEADCQLYTDLGYRVEELKIICTYPHFTSYRFPEQNYRIAIQIPQPYWKLRLRGIWRSIFPYHRKSVREYVEGWGKEQ